MNQQQINRSYAAIIANNNSRHASDFVQLTINDLEQSGRDLRNVTLEEFKNLLMRKVRRQSEQAGHLVGC